jgi:hypothetical protein
MSSNIITTVIYEGDGALEIYGNVLSCSAPIHVSRSSASALLVTTESSRGQYVSSVPSTRRNVGWLPWLMGILNQMIWGPFAVARPPRCNRSDCNAGRDNCTGNTDTLVDDQREYKVLWEMDDSIALTHVSLCGSGDLMTTATSKTVLVLVSSGSGNMCVSTEDVDKALINISGSGEVEVCGNVTRLKARLTGSGALCMNGSVVHIEAIVDGSGDVYGFFLKGSATLALRGSGDVCGKAGLSTTIKAQHYGSGCVKIE